MLGITTPLTAMSESFMSPQQLTSTLRPFFKENSLPLDGKQYAHTDYILKLIERTLREPSFECTTVAPQQVSSYCKFFIQHNDTKRRQNAAFLARCILCLESAGKLSLEEARFIVALINGLKQFPAKEASSFTQREACLKVITPYLLATYAKKAEVATAAEAAADDAGADITAASSHQTEETIESESDEEIATLRYRRGGRSMHRQKQHKRGKNPSPVAAPNRPAPLPPLIDDYDSDAEDKGYCSCLCSLLRRCCRI